jgi:hypothetical protein
METTRFNLNKPFMCPMCSSDGSRTTYGQAVFKTPSRSNSTIGSSKIVLRSAEQERDEQNAASRERDSFASLGWHTSQQNKKNAVVTKSKSGNKSYGSSDCAQCLNPRLHIAHTCDRGLGNRSGKKKKKKSKTSSMKSKKVKAKSKATTIFSSSPSKKKVDTKAAERVPCSKCGELYKAGPGLAGHEKYCNGEGSKRSKKRREQLVSNQKYEKGAAAASRKRKRDQDADDEVCKLKEKKSKKSTKKKSSSRRLGNRQRHLTDWFG